MIIAHVTYFYTIIVDGHGLEFVFSNLNTTRVSDSFCTLFTCNCYLLFLAIWVQTTVNDFIDLVDVALGVKDSELCKFRQHTQLFDLRGLKRSV